MNVEIDIPLLLPYVSQIKEQLLSNPGKYKKITFKECRIDAAGLQLIAAIRKEYPGVSIEFAAPGPQGPEGLPDFVSNMYFKILERKGMVYAPNSGRG